MVLIARALYALRPGPVSWEKGRGVPPHPAKLADRGTRTKQRGVFGACDGLSKVLLVRKIHNPRILIVNTRIAILAAELQPRISPS